MTARATHLHRIVEIANKAALQDGNHPTLIPFLSFYRRSAPTPFSAGVLTPSFCLIAQGSKKVHIGREIYRYRAGDFLASIIDMPAAGCIVGATPSSPYLGLRIELTTQEIATVAAEASIPLESQNRKPSAGAFVGNADQSLMELFVRLLELLDRPKETSYVSELLKREMIFRLLSGPHGHIFLQPAFFDPKTDGAGRVVQWIRANYAKSFTVEELAKKNRMSVSSLHHKFKALTTMGPLQYQKQLRLQEARRLLMSGSTDATSAALEVGYESPSQFSREYRRLFGLPPLQDAKAFRMVDAE
jgi:AraC-like DNA-binding protein